MNMSGLEQPRILKNEVEDSRERINPIMVCLETSENVTPGTAKLLKLIEQNGLDVDFLKKTGGVISEVDNQDKFSKGYRNCTGAIVVGKSKTDPSKNLSILSHQMPHQLYANKTFIENLKKKLEEFREQTISGTIDAVIIGGNDRLDDFQEYTNSVDDLNGFIKDSLGIDAVVAAGPNISQDKEDGWVVGTDIYFDTTNRRLFIIRSEQPDNITNNSFSPENLANEKEKWKKYTPS